MRWLISLSAILLVALGACSDLNPLGVGDRCNPNRNGTDDPHRMECGGNLACVTPANCSQAYCCPDPATSQPGMVVASCMACPPPDDAGTE